jgi:hypothetical protein
MSDWTLNDEQVRKILETEPKEIKEIKVFSDIYLTKEDRIKHATKILEEWKNKHE